MGVLVKSLTAQQAMLYSVHFMRFIAAAAVVVHHSLGDNSRITVGAAGVDLFFVISGLVICLSTRSNDTAGSFVLRRFIRVIPIYWVATGLFVLVRYCLWGEVPSASQVVSSVFLFPLFGDGPQNFPIYYPAWTLQYEMLFYGIFATMMVFRSSRPGMASAAALSILACLTIPIFWRPGSESFNTLLLLEFVFGVALFEMVRANYIPSKRAGLIVLTASIIAFICNSSLAGAERTIAWGIPGFMMLIGLLAFEDAKWLRSRAAVLLGSASYSIYLTHVSVLVFLLELQRWGEIGSGSIILSPVASVVICSALGVAFHVLAERPLVSALQRVFMGKKATHQ